MDGHFICGTLVLFSAFLGFYKAKEEGNCSARRAWSTTMIAGLGVAQLVQLLPTGFCPPQLSLILVGFIYGVALTAGFVAATTKGESPSAPHQIEM